MELSVKEIALVTGGSRGIGREICFELAKRGKIVIFTYLKSQKQAEEVIEKLNQISGEPMHAAYACDMSDSKAVSQLFTSIRKEFGDINILINNAGITGSPKLFPLLSDNEWNNVFNTNLGSVLNTCRLVIPRMIQKKRGVIINITSISAHKGTPGSAPYSASKAAIIALTKTIFREIGEKGINIFAVSPGLIDTDMTKDTMHKLQSHRYTMPLRRIGYPEEVSNLVAYLATEAPSYLGGQEIVIDGLQL